MADDQDSGFIRQRRNLMIISLILLFSEVSKLKVSKLSAFGNELLIDEPYAVTTALWIAGVYWLLRFYQYSRPLFWEAIQATIRYRVQETCLPTALSKLLRDNPALSMRPKDVNANPTVSVADYTFVGQEANFLKLKLTVHKSTIGDNKAVNQQIGPYELQINGADLRKLRMRAWMHLVVHTSKFTDFILPYVLFVLPIIYACYIAIHKD